MALSDCADSNSQLTSVSSAGEQIETAAAPVAAERPPSPSSAVEASQADKAMSSSASGMDRLLSHDVMKSKEELAVEDRRRRNRETQRAIRQRKAAKLQDSEVKVALHEQEIAKLKQKLVEAEQEAADLRQQLEHCKCRQPPGRSTPSPPVGVHDRQSPVQILGKRKTSDGESETTPSTASDAVLLPRPRPSVLQPFPATVSPKLPRPISTITTLASLPLKDLTHAPAASGSGATWSKPNSGSSYSSRLFSAHGTNAQTDRSDSQYSMTDVSPLATYAGSFLNSSQPGSFDKRSTPLLEKSSRLESPVALENTMSSLSTDEIHHPPAHTCCTAACTSKSNAPQPAPRTNLSSLNLPPLGQALEAPAYSARYGMPSYHGYSPSSSRPPSAHAEQPRPILPPLHRQYSTTRNGKGKSISYPVTAVDLHEALLPSSLVSSRHSMTPSDYPTSFSPGTYSRASSVYEDGVGTGTAGISTKDHTQMEGVQIQNGTGLPQSSSVLCCNGFIRCDEEADKDFMRGVGYRSTLDDFQELFGNRPEL